jgi:hypothetical protein
MPPVPTPYFHGCIDEFCLFGPILSHEEIQQVAGIVPPAPEA